MVRGLCSSGTTGNPKIEFYEGGKMTILKKQINFFYEKIGFNNKHGMRDTYSFFPMTLPNLGFWQTTLLGDEDWIVHFDVGEAFNVGEGLPKFEYIKMLMDHHPPNLIAGRPKDLIPFLKASKPLPMLTHLVHGDSAPTKELMDLVKEKCINAEFISIYGQTETGICMVTEKGKHNEGYCIPEWAKVKVDHDELIVNGFRTGDKGFINDFGKVDLKLTRLRGEERFDGCGQ